MFFKQSKTSLNIHNSNKSNKSSNLNINTPVINNTNNSTIPTLSEHLKTFYMIKPIQEHNAKNLVETELTKFYKTQEKDYFTEVSNIRFGKLSKPIIKTKKELKTVPYSYVGPLDLFCSTSHFCRQSPMKRQSTIVSSSTGRKRSHTGSNKEVVDNRQYIDNKALTNYYESINQKINGKNLKQYNKTILLSKLPLPIKKSLINQERMINSYNNVKNKRQKIEKVIIKKTKKNNGEDLLGSTSTKFQDTMQEKNIVDNNLKNDFKYKDNFWNITLRNKTSDGKYEKKGYINVGDNYDPRYIFFDINLKNEFIKNLSNCGKKKINNSLKKKEKFNKKESKSEIKLKIKNDKFLNFVSDENFHEPKTIKDLERFYNIKDLEIKGRNLLTVEAEREKKIRGRKLFYTKQNINELYIKEEKLKLQNNQNNLLNSHNNQNDIKNLYNHKNGINVPINKEKLLDDRMFAKNCNIKDFYKNLNLDTKCGNLINSLKDS